jgi:hypothetical protein
LIAFLLRKAKIADIFIFSQEDYEKKLNETPDFSFFLPLGDSVFECLLKIILI